MKKLTKALMYAAGLAFAGCIVALEVGVWTSPDLSLEMKAFVGLFMLTVVLLCAVGAAVEVS